MSDSDRRAAVRTLAALAVLPLVPAPLRAAGPGPGPVVFPRGGVVLERLLERQLADGARIAVTRSWACSFATLGAGARVEARQVAVQVDAPAALSAFARLEESRDASGIFPLELDRTGAIVGWRADGGSGVGEAVERAIAQIDAHVTQATERQDARSFVAGIGETASALVSQIPRDLFFPVPGSRKESRPVELADGLKGSYEVAMTASTQPQSGLLDVCERQIATQVGETRRETREVWRIRPA